jgi:hypothetical protein
MRKEYDFSGAVPFHKWRRERKRARRAQADIDAAADVSPLTRAQIRELDRRIKDSEDRTRYLLVSVFGPKFALYYNVSEDSYGMNDARYATLFKRRAAAQAVKAQLGPGVQLVRCRVDKRRRLVLASLPKLRARWPRLQKGRRLTSA